MRRRDYLKLVTASTTSPLILSGCLNSTEDDGTTSPTQTPSSPASEVPTITNPLDVSGIKTDPCTALSSEQLQKLGLKAGKEESEESGQSCKYKYANGSYSHVTIEVSEFKTGWDGVYARKKITNQFRETEIRGYPAVFASLSDKAARGFCQVYIGLADTSVVRLTITLSSDTSDYGLSCDVIKVAADYTIQNLTAATETTDPTLSSTLGTVSKNEVPTVTNPLDVSTLKSDPSTALSSNQLQKLGLAPSKKGSTPLSDYCKYEYTDEYSFVEIGVLKRFKNGLADIYSRKKAFNTFEITQIAGYPAVYANLYHFEVEKAQTCRLYVGLTDTCVVVVYPDLVSGTSDYGQPCDVSKQTAKAMIQNLKDGT